YDAETGSHYNYFRNLDPSVGRYLQSDPLGIKAGSNTYNYVANNALRWIDPKGLIVYLCTRPAFRARAGEGVFANHPYIWNDVTHSPCGFERSSGTGNPIQRKDRHPRLSRVP